MGCLRLPYDHQGEGLEKSTVHFLGRPLEKNPATSFFCNDYTPFGGRFNSYAVAPENKYLFQGQEHQDETGWDQFEARMYDPIIGRWLQVDPAGQHWSPYLGMGNNPVNGVDPDGGWDIIFRNNSGQEISRILTPGEDQYIDVKTDYVPETPVIIDLNQIIAEYSPDAIGIGFEGSFTFGGGVNGGLEYVLFLAGQNEGQVFGYSRLEQILD